MISLAIQHHPSRPAALARLRAQLPSAEVVTDPAPDAEWNMWRTYRLALEQTPECSHRVIIQDDCIVCDGFHDKLSLAIKAHPDRLLILCMVWWQLGSENCNRFDTAYTAGDQVCELKIQPTVCVYGTVWPKAMVSSILDWWPTCRYATPWPLPRAEMPLARHEWDLARRSDSDVIGLWSVEQRVAPLALVPSLVEHPDDMPSTYTWARMQQEGGMRRRALAYADNAAGPRAALAQ